MNKLAQSMKWTSLAVLAIASVIVASGAHAAAVKVGCIGLVGGPSASLGAVSATWCTDLLENTNRNNSPAYNEYYTGFDGGGWVQVSAFDTNSDSGGQSFLFFDGLQWTGRTNPTNFNGVTSPWSLTIAAQDPANTPTFPRTYDLLLVIVRGGDSGTNPQADSIGYLLEDFTYSQLGSATGSFTASFNASDTSSNSVRGLDVFARAVGDTTPPRVPEPGSMLLLVIAAVAAIGVGRSKVSAWRTLRTVA